MASVDDVDGGETFDEEAEERDECEIEHLLNEFVDEPCIRHDQIPESDDEEEKASRSNSHLSDLDMRGTVSSPHEHFFEIPMTTPPQWREVFPPVDAPEVFDQAPDIFYSCSFN